MKPFLFGLMSLVMAGCFSATNQQAPVSQSVGPSGGSVRSSDGMLTVEVPAGALASTQTITLTPVTASLVPSTAQAIGQAYEIGPSSLQLAGAVHLTLEAPAGTVTASDGTAIFAAAEGLVASTPLASTIDPADAVEAQLSAPSVVQLGHFLVMSGGPSSSTSGGTTGSGSGTTGGGTTTGSSGDACAGAVGTTGGPAMFLQCQLESAACDGTVLNEVKCVQGNCQCFSGGVQTAEVQNAGNVCGQVWDACGFPPGPPFGAVGSGTTGGTAGGGSATIDGLFASSDAASSYQLSFDGENELSLALSQNGLCGGLEATGTSVFIGVTSDAEIGPGDYALGGPPGAGLGASLTVLDWDDDAGIYGVVGTCFDGGLSITSLDGGLMSGSFAANVALNDGGTAPISGSFTDVPSCQR
ncbi:MAG: hypothetical protein JST54_35410 [Deltaproteobacteria bacterium]|nr:hypothetical protein [Deltaproteobacteria bacterium]